MTSAARRAYISHPSRSSTSALQSRKLIRRDKHTALSCLLSSRSISVLYLQPMQGSSDHPETRIASRRG